MIDDRSTDRDPRDTVVEGDPQPVVTLPSAGLPGTAILLGAIVLGLVLFIALDMRRRQLERPADGHVQTVPIRPPSPLVLPPEALPTPIALQTPLPALSLPLPSRYFQPPSYYQPPQQTILMPTAPSPQAAGALAATRGLEPTAEATSPMSAPALVIDGGVTRRTAPASTQGATPGPPTTPPGGSGGGGRDDTPAQATVLGSHTTSIIIGTVIPAVLETPVDTARPGLVRALVSRDTPGFDGKRVLVPKGSRLIGDYQSDVQGGQNRVLVTWTRLIRPDGVSIRLASPASDPLGGAGIPGRAHTFFIQRFAGAILQSALAVGVAIAARPGNGSVIVGLPTGPINTVGQQIQSATDYRPKITVKQGAAINVFVAHDLDFSTVEAAQ